MYLISILSGIRNNTILTKASINNKAGRRFKNIFNPFLIPFNVFPGSNRRETNKHPIVNIDRISIFESQ
ncbi:MAG: hypothetical protein A2X03_16240 [Bacteroidetes bacterium GWA2_40_15]|nr:MAG: hypothetical protein A2X03_16240 [Bacteroidetes bacterium GWA2_40_15]OFX94082.1 MAG: hypothetical protein A2X06_15145 [Bacteroidetes bacterium GWC2_40_22]